MANKSIEREFTSFTLETIKPYLFQVVTLKQTLPLHPSISIGTKFRCGTGIVDKCHINGINIYIDVFTLGRREVIGDDVDTYADGWYDETDFLFYFKPAHY